MTVDFTRDHSPSDWLPRLAGIDVVVNAVGILRETADASFEALHVAAPRALFAACDQARIGKVIQVSALGADDAAASRYHRSKKSADDFLASLSVPWVIVQPSLVYGDDGASARLFTTLAALPVVPLPGGGGQRVQPIHVDDLAEAVVRLAANGSHDRERVAAVGARPLTLRELLAALRHSMGLGKPRFLSIPTPLVRAAAAAGDHLPGVLLDRESLAMLERGNVASAATITDVLRKPPRAVESFIVTARAVDAANAARLAWLLPVLRVSVALVWLVTGLLSLGVYPVADSYALLARLGLTGVVSAIALYGAAIIDLAFGVGSLVLKRRLWLWRAQAALIIGYSVIIAIWLPEFWAHPFAPMLKNVPMLAAILVLHEFEKKSDG